MVWDLSFRPEGDRYPRTRFVGYDFHDARLENTENDEQLALLRGVSALLCGRPLDPQFVAKQVYWGSRRKPFDYFKLHAANIISSRFKAIVEALEPDVHQFFPVAVTRKDGTKIADHWMWVVCNLIDGVDRGKTTLLLWKGGVWTASYRDDHGEWCNVPDPKLIFSLKQCAGYHFWFDKHLHVNKKIICSDAAAMMLMDAKLSGLKFMKMDAV